MTKEKNGSAHRYCFDRLHRDRVKNVLNGKRTLYDYNYLHESINSFGS